MSSRSASRLRWPRVKPAGVLVRLLLLAVAALFSALPARAEETPDAALAALLDSVRAEAHAPGACAQPRIDRLVRLYCTDRIRVGSREYYPLFGAKTGDVWQGYEIDVGRAIAERLGIGVEFSKVKAASRIALLADDGIDLVIATMGDNTDREGQASQCHRVDGLAQKI